MDRKPLYLLLVCLGVFIPMSAFVPWLLAHGLDLPLFVHQLFANRISTFFTLDLLLTAVCIIHLCWLERGNLKQWWLPMAVTCLVGASAGLPLLLYLRARAEVARN
jgi:hypothetical protein